MACAFKSETRLVAVQPEGLSECPFYMPFYIMFGVQNHNIHSLVPIGYTGICEIPEVLEQTPEDRSNPSFNR